MDAHALDNATQKIFDEFDNLREPEKSQYIYREIGDLLGKISDPDPDLVQVMFISEAIWALRNRRPEIAITSVVEAMFPADRYDHPARKRALQEARKTTVGMLGHW